MKTYKSPRHRSRASRLRAALDQMSKSNRLERGRVNLDGLAKQVRERLQRQYPNATPEQIESRVSLVMTRGSKPTTAKKLEPGTIPIDVLKARKAERKLRAKANRPRRQQEERLRRAQKELRDELT